MSLRQTDRFTGVPQTDRHVLQTGRQVRRQADSRVSLKQTDRPTCSSEKQTNKQTGVKTSRLACVSQTDRHENKLYPVCPSDRQRDRSTDRQTGVKTSRLACVSQTDRQADKQTDRCEDKPSRVCPSDIQTDQQRQTGVRSSRLTRARSDALRTRTAVHCLALP